MRASTHFAPPNVSRGIGRATAILAGKRGWSLGVNYVYNSVAARATVNDVKVAGGSAIALHGNVEHEQDIAQLFDSMEKCYGGRVNGVVINAGITAEASDLADMDVERLRRMVDVNVMGTLLCAREAARRLPISRGGNGGSIVFVSSKASKIGSPHEYVDYAASKGAVDSLTLGLSKELAQDGVRVNTVRPGHIKTEIHKTTGDPDRAERLGKLTPIGRPGEADEVAEAILWLLSPASSYVTGSFIDVSGGR
ncbi:putative oxidoreductase YgfF [Pseudocercospora fuligena]|uniref:Putative oxidoreductase YgfF n=1 Tax=Pseudocercospora fuligena TaxID=685502 RepID=A0A8H6RJZ4_9PEZI|nr:putative oxidoreductase YgfF [Pseudocercospora fuligena]